MPEEAVGHIVAAIGNVTVAFSEKRPIGRMVQFRQLCNDFENGDPKISLKDLQVNHFLTY
jgi:hypothetical protein